MWDRGWQYLRKAGTIILGIAIVMWAMTAFPKKQSFDRDYEAELAAAESDLQKVEIEQAKQAEILLSQNCNYGQGYYFSEPLKHNELSEFLQNQNSQADLSN